MNILMVTVLLTLIMKDTLGQSESWTKIRKPIMFGSQIPSRALKTGNPKVMKKIVNLHNFFRTKVNPPASNMLEMKWHSGAADRARNWSEQCRFLIHDHESNRYVRNLGNCGQNIFVSGHKLGWRFVVKTWFLEFHNFTYGSDNNNLKAVGHYTQMVWATTHKVGCHLTWCPHGAPWRGHSFYNYVCDYCPTGNWDGKLGTPYKIGNPCSHCPRSCKYGKLCTNYCPYVDTWSNCQELTSYGKGWLCGNDDVQGRTRFNHCKATCTCKNKIHEWL